VAANRKLFDVVMVGAGIMSATLATLPGRTPAGDEVPRVRSGWRTSRWRAARRRTNAGTATPPTAKLNYTPEKPDGSVDIAKALAIKRRPFETSLQLWSTWVEKGA